MDCSALVHLCLLRQAVQAEKQQRDPGLSRACQQRLPEPFGAVLAAHCEALAAMQRNDYVDAFTKLLAGSPVRGRN
jgi:hypothetical protein